MAHRISTIGINDESVQIPKQNQKEIGIMAENDRVYIEDYVVTYLTQLAKEQSNCGPMALFGRSFERDSKRTYYIYGAVCAPEQQWEEGMEISRAISDAIIDKKKEYFERLFFLGWAISAQNTPNDSLNSVFGRAKLFLHVVNDKLFFYRYAGNEPERLPGYSIFYAQNDAMQNYLIAWHDRKYGAYTEHHAYDTAEDCRFTLHERKQNRFRNLVVNMTLGICVLMMITICCVGVATLNQYDKMKDVEETLKQISEDTANSEEYVGEAGDVEDYAVVNCNADEVVISTEISEEESVTEDVQTSGESAVEDVQTSGESAVEDAQTSREPTAEDVQTSNGSNRDVTSQKDMTYVDDNAEVNQKNSIPESYIVKKGDNLSMISKSFYGSVEYVDEICKKNSIVNKNEILCGQIILLP